MCIRAAIVIIALLLRPAVCQTRLETPDTSTDAASTTSFTSSTYLRDESWPCPTNVCTALSESCCDLCYKNAGQCNCFDYDSTSCTHHLDCNAKEQTGTTRGWWNAQPLHLLYQLLCAPCTRASNGAIGGKTLQFSSLVVHVRQPCCSLALDKKTLHPPPGTGASCCDWCADTPECTAWLYDKGPGICILMTDPVDPWPYVTFPSDNVDVGRTT